MTKLIPLDAAIAAITLGRTITQNARALQAIPTIDPTAIRNAALREAIQALRDWQDNLILCGYREAPVTVGMAADVVESLIGEKK